MQPQKPVQVVFHEDDGTFVARPEGLAFLRSLQPGKMLKVVSCTGMYRTGKSLLMNHLVGQICALPVLVPRLLSQIASLACLYSPVDC